MSQYDLAEALHVSQSSVGSWETGTRKPDIDMLYRLADFFDVSSDYLLGREDVPGIEPEPVAVAAHATADITPELEERINELVRLALEKYSGKEVK